MRVLYKKGSLKLLEWLSIDFYAGCEMRGETLKAFYKAF